ncbi:MAG: AIPR protein [Brevundimonas subvibrioides]|uniref:AIPR protein n=1 Tax=Brevundimonas subvibrioides TaxID=74313 RepID=A0A258HG76_9CAUL|nr:AIPR family protein [Brevundimonas subvibrioides]OYX55759.1 MAG: AIPR protein [Brevundimonas subvibrioides]
MTETVEDFHEDFFNEIRTHADAGGRFMESAFLESYGEWLVNSGEFETFDVAPYRAARGMRVDAYGGDPLEAEGVLSLAVVDFNPDSQLVSLTKTDVEAAFKRLENFLRASLTDGFRDQLEESSPGYGLAELIHARRAGINRVRLFLISNRALKARYDGIDAGTVDGLAVSYNVWDMGRLHRLVASGRGKEDIEIDFMEQFGQRLPCLPAHVGGDGYEAYLSVVPGELLSRIYDKWGARLLEANVRSFLQARGGVNKGIRNTILNDPGMFFAYNNGVTATAEQVETVVENGTTYISSLTNLQIVNGGQTTASIFSAGKKDKANLERIFVQMKLSVVDPERAMEVVPKISEFANSQNKVNAADFFANHPFHVRMEEFSRRIWAPALDGTFTQSKWFYERARGSYDNARAYLTKAKRDAFDVEYPKVQRFAKTDLAKFEMVWEGCPDLVSKGAQKTFGEYAKLAGQRWDKDSDAINELYFRAAVAKAIVFRNLESLVSEQQWYQAEGGYRAQIVAYTIAKFDDLLKSGGLALNFDMIWKEQALPSVLARTLVDLAEVVRPAIVQPDSTVANISEWAKKSACWSRVQALSFELPEELDVVLLDRQAKKAVAKDAKAVQKMDNGIEAQARVMKLGPSVWSRAGAYAAQRKLLSPADHSLIGLAARRAIPTEKQSIRLVEALGELEADGFMC